MQTRFLGFLINLLICAPLLCQNQHGELTVSPPESLNTVVRNATQSVLIIVSQVPDLQLESTGHIFETRQRGASEWQLFVAPDSQSFTIQAPGYLPIKTSMMYLKPKRAYRLKVSQVKPAPGTLSITTKPAGASLRLNGAPIAGKTPFRLETALPGRYVVQVRKTGYQPRDTSLHVESARVTAWEIALAQTAVRVQIGLRNENLRDVGILIDGEARGVAPGAIYLLPGRYKLMLQKERYTFKEKVINIALGPEEIRLSEKLSSKSKFYKKWWFWGSAAGVAGGVGVFLVVKGIRDLFSGIGKSGS